MPECRNDIYARIVRQGYDNSCYTEMPRRQRKNMTMMRRKMEDIKKIQTKPLGMKNIVSQMKNILNGKRTYNTWNKKKLVHLKT